MATRRDLPATPVVERVLILAGTPLWGATWHLGFGPEGRLSARGPESLVVAVDSVRRATRGPQGESLVADSTDVDSEIITVRTGTRPSVVDITAQATSFVSGRGDGLLHVFVPHATAGVAIIETGAGSDKDLLTALDDVLPADERWRHRHGSRGHGRDHVMPAFVAPYASLPVLGGQIALGTWQSVCLVDLNGDNPTRQVRLSFLQA